MHTRTAKATPRPLTYCLVAKQHVDVRHDLHEVVLEELADEGRREVQAKQLVIFRRMLGHLQYGLQRHGEEETLGTKGDIGSQLNLLFISRCGQMNPAGEHSVLREHQ